MSPGCTDAWLLRADVPGPILDLLDFPQNHWGAEAKLMYEMSEQGFEVSNPCLLLRSYHNHDSNQRPGQFGNNQEQLNRDGSNFACCPSDRIDAGCLGCKCSGCTFDKIGGFEHWYNNIATHGSGRYFLEGQGVDEGVEWPDATDALQEACDDAHSH